MFLNEVKNALELERRISAEAVPPRPRSRPRWPGGWATRSDPAPEFLEDYRRITRRARQAMERVFYGEEG